MKSIPQFLTCLVGTLVVAISPVAASFAQETSVSVTQTGLETVAGDWNARLAGEGYDIEFGLNLRLKDNIWTGFFINGPEQIKIPKIHQTGSKLILDIDHYDSKIVFSTSDDFRNLEGYWEKQRGKKTVKMRFFANRPSLVKSKPESAQGFLGRYAVKFQSSEDPAVAIFNPRLDNLILGTFLTTTGDYRYLDGKVKNGQLHLSCFDGAHAFHFTAKHDKHGGLAGEFWSSNTWHETWTAKRDENAKLPDAFEQTEFTGDSEWGSISFPDLNGKPTRLDDPQFAGKARIIYVFGSWCPNCHDAAAYFAKLNKQYGDRGLSILGLAFEMTGDFERDAAQVKKYLARHGSQYPVLVAGLSDKKAASKSLKILDRVRSYPTTIFVDRNGKVQGVHTGFTGPATGKAYSEMTSKFESLIESMLSNTSGK